MSTHSRSTALVGPHPWTRFEIATAISTLLFIAAGLVGLGAAWLGIAFSPAAVGVLSPSESLELYWYEAGLITASIAIAFSARSIVVHEWLRIARVANSTNMESLKAVHGWVTGLGLVSAWASIIMPLWAAALLTVSSFLSLIVVGMIYGSVRSIVTGHAALIAYVEVRARSTRPGVGPLPYGSIFVAGMSVSAAISAVNLVTPIVMHARSEMTKPIALQLEAVRQQIVAQEQDGPILDSVMAEKVSAETEAVEREAANAKKGIGSQQEVYLARQRLLTAQAEALKVAGDARRAMQALRAEELDLETRLKHANSAAPALSVR